MGYASLSLAGFRRVGSTRIPREVRLGLYAAQLAERFHGMEEVRGSIPLSSTKSCEARPGGGFRAFRGLMPSGMNHPRASPCSKEIAMDERLFEEF